MQTRLILWLLAVAIGQGALMSLNIHPCVICGYCIDPADAFLLAQIKRYALSLPFAKGFGWR